MLRIRTLVAYPSVVRDIVPERNDKAWTLAHDDYIRRWFSTRSIRQLADTLDYDESTVKRHAKALGLV